MRRFLRSAIAASLTSIALATMLATGPASAAYLSYTQMTLINDWVAYAPDTRAASAAIDARGIVHLRGAIKQTLSHNYNIAFALPLNMRPNKPIYLITNMNNAAPGRLYIYTDGTVWVQATGDQSDAWLFTSLDGVSFPQN